MSKKKTQAPLDSFFGYQPPRPVNFAEVNKAIIPQEGKSKDKTYSLFRKSDISDIEVLPEYRYILECIEAANNRALFVTGEAGTGKSTLIRYLVHHAANVALVAPTAIAAMNIKGVTIHSLFSLPPHHLEPTQKYPVSRQNRLILEKVPCLIIDEVSMVPPNLVDVIDRSLRYIRNDDRPFGGITVLFIGDLFQLPPVVVDKEASIYFSHRYRTKYFFSAEVFELVEITPIKLEQVRRQKDLTLIKSLADIRQARGLDESLGLFNRRCYLEKRGGERTNSMCLVPTNAQANSINEIRLAELPGESVESEARIQGDRSAQDWRIHVPYLLKLKLGAKVVLLKNNKPDWINGDTGKVVGIKPDGILILLDASDNTVLVGREKWIKYRYAYDYKSKTIVCEGVASFEQFPMALGWAITIHKSQGMSFSDYSVDFGAGAFDTGQVYVALSRARNIEGLRLCRPIGKKEVKTDPVITEFYSRLGIL